MLLDGNLQGAQHLGIPVTNIERAKAWYVDILGFTVPHEPTLATDEGDIRVAFLTRDDVTLELYQLVGEALAEVGTRGHGHIDHFALDVLDIEGALEDARAAGATLDESTADGPVALPAVWTAGVRYVFLSGPDGEKVEFNQRLDLDPARRGTNLGGWAHLGVPVTDMDRSRAFYERLGFAETMLAEIPVGDEAILISMMERAGFTMELYRLLGDDLAEVAQRADGHIDHIAFDVLDAASAYDQLTQAGFIPLEEEPVFLPFWENGVKYFNVRGPDGEKIEFNQRIK
jgi:catechol 2,3-dioxygenase-like lactoylglutathione lyase family enzyme